MEQTQAAKNLPEMDMQYLQYKVKKLGFNQESFVKAVGLSKTSYYNRLIGRAEWTCGEMIRTRDLLKLSQDEFKKIFGL